MIPVGQPYRAAGPISFKSVLTTLILGTVVALLAALVVWGWELSPIPTLVILTPLIQGFVIGLIMALMIGRLRMRNPKLLLLIGFACGLASVVMVHYGHYLHSVDMITAGMRKEVEAVPGMTPDQKKEFLAELDKDPRGAADAFFVDRTGSKGFVGSMLLRNQIGVDIKRSNVNGVGLWILWGFEALMVAGTAGALSYSAASKPFCEDCEAWCVEKPSPITLPGHHALPLAEVVQLDDHGKFIDLHDQVLAEVAQVETPELDEAPKKKKKSKTLVVTTAGSTLHSCPGCDQTFADVWLKTDTTKSNKTETKTKSLVSRLRVSPEMAFVLRNEHNQKPEPLEELPEPEPEPEPEAG